MDRWIQRKMRKINCVSFEMPINSSVFPFFAGPLKVDLGLQR